jgi:hypothetical protein
MGWKESWFDSKQQKETVSLLQIVQTSSAAHPASYLMGTTSFQPWE